jgi:hypothetical protein
MTVYPPAHVPTGRLDISGVEHILGPKGEKLPVTVVKPQHLMEDELVRAEVAHALALSEQLSRFMAHTLDNLGAYEALIAEQYGAKVGGPKGNKTLMTYDGLFKISVQVADQVMFGPELQVAKSLVDECLTDWAAGAGDELKAVIQRAFNTDKEGQINRAALYSLLRLDIADTRWREAMQAIRDAMRIVGSKSYVRFYQRPTADAAWEPISIDLARA